MDLSEKRKQLEALRAARLKKQQLVDQVNADGTATKPASTPVALSAPAPAAKPLSPAAPIEPATATTTSSPAVTKARPASAAATRDAVAPEFRPTPAPTAAAGVSPKRKPSPKSPRPTSAPMMTTSSSAPAPQPARARSPLTPSGGGGAGPAAKSAAAAPPAQRRASPPRASSPSAPAAPAPVKKPNITVVSVQPSPPPPPPPQAAAPGKASAMKVSSSAPAKATQPTAGNASLLNDTSSRRAQASSSSSAFASPKQDRASGFATAPTATRAAVSADMPSPTAPAAPSITPLAAGEGGLDVFHRWGTVSEDSVMVSQCVPACALSGKVVIGSKGRIVRATAVTQLPVQPPGCPQAEFMPCVIAAYAKPPFPASSGTAGAAQGPQRERSPSLPDLVASASNSVGGMDHSLSAIGGRVSPTNAASLTAGPATIAEPELDIAVRDPALSDTGYAWGTSVTSRVHRFAGPCPNATPCAATTTTTERAGLTGTALKASMIRLARSAPGLAIAWTVVVLHELEDGSVADTLTVVTPLVCDSEICCLATDPMRPTTLYGGLRCGRIVCWSLEDDWGTLSAKQLRAKALASTGSEQTYFLRPRRPTRSTFPSPLAHQAAVLHIGVHGDFSSPQLFSVSQEGKVCTWSALDPSMPTTSRSAYIGSRFLGGLASTAAFTRMRGTGAIMDVIIGTNTGSVLRGINRDNRVVELTSLWQSPHKAATASGGDRASASGMSASPDRSMRAESASSPLGASFVNVSGESGRFFSGDRSGSITAGMGAAMNGVMNTWGLGLGSATGGSTPPHLGIVTAVAVQPLALTANAHGGSGPDASQGQADEGTDACVVSAATDGSCVAWVDKTAIPLSGFLSIVTCLRWSPTHPNVFAAGDAFGLVTLWNLQKSVTVPIAKVMLGAALPTTRNEDANTPILPLHPSMKRGQRVADYLGQPLRGRIRPDNEARAPSAPPDTDAATSNSSASESDTDALENEEGMSMDVVAPGEGAAAVTALTFSLDGHWLFAANATGTVYVLMLSRSLWR